ALELAHRLVRERAAIGGWKGSQQLETWLDAQSSALGKVPVVTSSGRPVDPDLQAFATRAALDALKANLNPNGRRGLANLDAPAALLVDRASLVLPDGTGAAVPANTLDACFGPMGV